MELPREAGPDSFSFLPVLEGRQPADRPIRGPIVMRTGSKATMIRSGDWKLIDHPGSGGFSKSEKPGPDTPPGQLYNLGKDRSERINLYREHPGIVSRLTAEMESIIRANRSRP
jgi:arylsulfatase A-like enzyme